MRWVNITPLCGLLPIIFPVAINIKVSCTRAAQLFSLLKYLLAYTA